MKLLITGGAGFIGANFVPYTLEKREDIHVITLDNLKEVKSLPRYMFVHGDICNQVLVETLFEKYQIDSVSFCS